MVTAGGTAAPGPVPYASSNIPPLLADSDMEADPDPPDWARMVPEAVLHNMTGRERKRQDIINGKFLIFLHFTINIDYLHFPELFHTERSHVRNLKVLHQLFYQPMTEQQILQPDQLTLLFQNLEEVLDIHSRWNNMMKIRRHESGPVVGNVGDMLLLMVCFQSYFLKKFSWFFFSLTVLAGKNSEKLLRGFALNSKSP